MKTFLAFSSSILVISVLFNTQSFYSLMILSLYRPIVATAHADVFSKQVLFAIPTPRLIRMLFTADTTATVEAKNPRCVGFP